MVGLDVGLVSNDYLAVFQTFILYILNPWYSAPTSDASGITINPPGLTVREKAQQWAVSHVSESALQSNPCLSIVWALSRRIKVVSFVFNLHSFSLNLLSSVCCFQQHNPLIYIKETWWWIELTSRLLFRCYTLICQCLGEIAHCIPKQNRTRVCKRPYFEAG